MSYLRRVVFLRPVDFRAVVFFRGAAFFFVVLRPVALRAVVRFVGFFFVVLRPVTLRAVVFFVVLRPVAVRAVVFFRPPALRVVFLRPLPLVRPDATGIGAGGGGVPGSGVGQLDAGSCCEPDQVSPRLSCSIKDLHKNWSAHRSR